MDPNAVTNLISSIGFPIVCCGALFWYNTKTMKEFSTEIRSSIEVLSKSINDNTAATIKLETTVEVMHKLGGDLDG